MEATFWMANYLLREPFVEFFLGVEHEALALCTFLALGHQGRHLVSLEQTGHFTVGKQCVHSLQETRVENVRLVHYEADLLALVFKTIV